MNSKTTVRSSIRRSLKNVEGGVQPLLNLITTLLQAGSSNFEECQKQIENFCYQLVIQSIQYLFDKNEVLNFVFKPEKDYKFVTFLFANKVKRFLSSNLRNPHVLQQIIKDLFEDAEIDGFSNEQSLNSGSSSESNKSKQGTRSKLKIQEQHILRNVKDEALLTLLDSKNKLINQLEYKLSTREHYISTVTAGYLKDLQNLREQLYRKDAGDEAEYYDVQYFDLADIADEKNLQLLNAKLSDLKSQFENKTNNLYKHIEVQKTELTEHRQTIAQLQAKTRHLDNAEFLVRRALHIEGNPYRFWKILQVLNHQNQWILKAMSISMKCSKNSDQLLELTIESQIDL